MSPAADAATTGMILSLLSPAGMASPILRRADESVWQIAGELSILSQRLKDGIPIAGGDLRAEFPFYDAHGLGRPLPPGQVKDAETSVAVARRMRNSPEGVACGSARARGPDPAPRNVT